MALGVLLVAALQSPKAETRSSSLQVRVNVVRACSVDTRDQGTIALTCSRGTAASVVSTGTAQTRIIPIPARQTTLVPTRAAGTATTAGGTTGPLTRQVITVNF